MPTQPKPLVAQNDMLVDVILNGTKWSEESQKFKEFLEVAKIFLVLKTITIFRRT